MKFNLKNLKNDNRWLIGLYGFDKLIMLLLFVFFTATPAYVFEIKQELKEIKQELEEIREEVKEIPQLETLDVIFKIDEGIASWYDYSLPCCPNYSTEHLTCASRDYPKWTYLIVERIETGEKITCVVNDYGPEEWTGRIIDLSSYSFGKLASLSKGLIKVKIYKLEN